MTKCIVCKNKDDGYICTHCLANGAHIVGKNVKTVLVFVGPVLVSLLVHQVSSLLKEKNED